MTTPQIERKGDQLQHDIEIPSSRSGSRQELRKEQVGVADYFAVLGIGEKLIWKHAPMPESNSNSNSSTTNASSVTVDDDLPAEDDAKMLERFYREIIDCQIWVADENPNAQFPSTVIYTNNSTRNRPSHTVALPTSPSPSDVTSLSAAGTEVETAAMEGWTVIQQTRPASLASITATQESPPMWNKGQTWDANLDPEAGLSSQIAELELEQHRRIEGRKTVTPLKDLRQKMQTSFQQRLVSYTYRTKKKFYLSFRRRSPADLTVPAIADLALFYVRLHKATIPVESSDLQTVAGSEKTGNSVSGSTVSQKGAAALLRVAEAGKLAFQNGILGNTHPATIHSVASPNSVDYDDPIRLESLLDLPSDRYEWSIPEPYRELRFPCHPPSSDPPYKTVLFANRDDGNDNLDSGIEIVQQERSSLVNDAAGWRSHLQPKVFSADQRIRHVLDDDDEYVFVPILAMRRQRIGEEERFHEDPAIVDMAVSFLDQIGDPVLPFEEIDPFEEESNDAGSIVLDKSAWAVVNSKDSRSLSSPRAQPSPGPRSDFGATCLLVRRNLALGFCDAAFSTSVLDRFPYKNYKGLPLPEEELPMFCYPTGCRLHRAKFCDAPLPEYYGFVVKNERGDSIYVSCVSFMEPLTQPKQRQLQRMSENRRRISLPHAKFWAKSHRRQQRRQGVEEGAVDTSMMGILDDESDDSEDEDFANILMTGFDDMVTFEKKTICLISRYPYWTAFRRFLSHLLSMSASPSDIPLERYISHLLLAVPLPRPGGPSVLIPLPTFSIPMMLWAPPSKDLPILDLPFERLVSCLDVPTLVTVVLGFLALEQKVILMSKRPSLVLDVCELLRSLLFPFDLCAPYVPRLTEPFVHTLDFPGAIFVGIHDDGTSTGLAATVRQNMPEDSTIVDLDSGTLDCSGDRMTVLKNSWGIIPPGPRSNLVSELETLCRDAGIVPGQEPLDSLVDPAFEATMPSTPVQDNGTLTNEHKEPLDDRCIRDAFLRFFCSVLGGYERYLVVPDVDFLVSGNEWFDAKGFLAAAPEENAAFLGTLVSTQLFQSFIQRRTEASDVHCLLFDDCLAEYHSSPAPYGRLGGDVETMPMVEKESSQLLYSLLVDQSAAGATPGLVNEKSFDGGDSSRPGSDADNSGHNGKSADIFESPLSHAEFAKNNTGDWVTLPSRFGLSSSLRYIYCIDGNPTFPDRLNPNAYFPRQPESWLVEMTTVPTPMLTRSDKEIEESDRRRKVATTYRGLPTHRRCLWQLPKLMGSHFLGAWLLCIPALVSQPLLTNDQQSKYLLRALGALRLLRNKQRIVPDEAAYRALIVACGRTKSDRRVELVKLFGFLRSDGIFPSAVTLGQYTKALAEGYSKQRTSGSAMDDETGTFELAESATRDGRRGNFSRAHVDDPDTILSLLDGDLGVLEESGRKWRQKTLGERDGGSNQEESRSEVASSKSTDRVRKKSTKSWLPVVTSWSLAPSRQPDGSPGDKSQKLVTVLDTTHLLAMWSRTKSCSGCGYIPLEEEVQAGWDVYGGENDIPGAINCPRCGEMLLPKLGYRAFTVGAALAMVPPGDSASLSQIPGSRSDETDATMDLGSLPPQMRPTIDEIREASYVTYLSPASLRLSLERHVEEHGEEILERHRLRELDPEVFYNLWFYCARFSLPLPLPVSPEDQTHYCAMVGWDYEVALRGCVSAAKVLKSLFTDETARDSQPSSNDATNDDNKIPLEAYGDFNLLARFNLQGYYATVWDHQDLSKVLVTLVEACDKRDFRPVVECLQRVNKRRRDQLSVGQGGLESLPSSNSNVNIGSDFANRSSLALIPTHSEGNDSAGPWPITHNNMEFECYRTALYLAKYQCTSAFHTFFPAILKPCKGYHFWCPIAPVPIFDRLLNDAMQRARAKSSGYIPIHDVSEVALGFRSVFGHLM